MEDLVRDLQVTHDDLAALDAWYWAYWNKLKLQGGEFSLIGHEYLIEPMGCKARVRVGKKGSQMGWTEAEVLRTLHGQIMGRYPQGVLYLFPTSDDVSDFSMARFGPLIEENVNAIGRYIRSTDRTNIKRIGSGMLYLRGARSTQKIEGLKKDASKLRSIPVDKVVFDEVDLMDEDMIQMALVRMSHSQVKEEAYISTPSIPDFGIDKRYNESDARIWIIKCSKCNRDCCLELDFPECVKFGKEGKAYRACVKCGTELFSRNGKWVSQYQNRSVTGYWISQLNSIFVDPNEILFKFNNPPNGNPQEVYNSMLGMAYISAENRLVPNNIYSYCGTDAISMQDYGPCGMGVDVGKSLHVVIGKRLSAKQRKVVWFGEVGEFEDLYDLIKKFNVRAVAVDYEPETRKAREFQLKAGTSVYLIDYKEKVKLGEKDDNRAGVTDVARTEICDAVHHAIVSGSYIFPRRCPQIEEYTRQMCNLAKILEEDKVKGTKIYRYRKLGPDHYRHATNYFELSVKNLAQAAEGDEVTQMLKTIMERRNEYAPLIYGLGVS